MQGSLRLGKMPFSCGLSSAKMAFSLAPESTLRLRNSGGKRYRPSHAARSLWEEIKEQLTKFVIKFITNLSGYGFFFLPTASEVAARAGMSSFWRVCGGVR